MTRPFTDRILVALLERDRISDDLCAALGADDAKAVDAACHVLWESRMIAYYRDADNWLVWTLTPAGRERAQKLAEEARP